MSARQRENAEWYRRTGPLRGLPAEVTDYQYLRTVSVPLQVLIDLLTANEDGPHYAEAAAFAARTIETAQEQPMSSTEDFRYTIFDQEFEPSVRDLSRVDNQITYSGGFMTDRKERPASEQEKYLQDEIVKAEHRLITLRYVQALREARESDPGWLRKSLGWKR